MINGIINIYKEKGFTSHDVVAKLRGILKQKKIGHTGTLDPDAVGVLPVCLGNATKLCDMLTDKKKEYVAKVRLGVVTDTQDMSGTVLEENEVTVTQEQVENTLRSFVGSYEQVPPMYSALKVNGKKLYELAREGKVIERKARPVEIYGIDILDMKLPVFEIRVSCSKGTYIRTLCHDIGSMLGCGAAMEELERTRSGSFTSDTALRLGEIEQRLQNAGEKREETLSDMVIPTDRMFEGYPRLQLLGEWERLVRNGNSFEERNLRPEYRLDHREDKSQYRVYLEENIFTGLYEYRTQEGKFCPVKMFL